MMDLDAIRELSKRAARDARKNRKTPFVPTEAQRATFRQGIKDGLNIPFLGNYVPVGFKRTKDDPWFVDTSGFGGSGEAAMNQDTLTRKIGELPPGHGVGLIEHGQFQGYVAVFQPRTTKV